MSKGRSPRPDLRGLSLDELQALVIDMGQPGYRAKQLAEWVFGKGAGGFDEMTNLPLSMRERLSERATLSRPEVIEESQSSDGTRKLLLEYADGARIEGVILRDDDRTTACVSTQVGCKFACSFCATGTMGFTRDLTAGEIVSQIVALRRASEPSRLNNLVFMGMGEPLDNYDSVLAAIRIANAPWGLGIGARRMTVSTVGLVPGIRRLAGEGLQVQLAVSLSAPEQKLRATIMPIAERYSIRQLTEALRYYSERTGRRPTLEYVLLDGINDSPEMAAALGQLARTLVCKVNLICYNRTKDSAYAPPTDKTVERFLASVRKRCPTVVRRVSRGDDIAAGCGQLCVSREGKS